MPSISRDVLSDQVEEHLLQAILDGRYPPGSRIVETRVARDLGVSQAPVREALRDLEALGVVEITSFRGASVRRPDKTELLEAYGVRAELEVLAARLALSRISDEVLHELQVLIDEMRMSAATGDRHAEALVDVRFHARLVAATGNGTLERVWRYLLPVARTYITLAAPGVDAVAAADLHRPILDALQMRDPELAAASIRRHFQAAGAAFEATFTQGFSMAATGAAASGGSAIDRVPGPGPAMEPMTDLIAVDNPGR